MNRQKLVHSPQMNGNGIRQLRRKAYYPYTDQEVILIARDFSESRSIAMMEINPSMRPISSARNHGE